MAHILVVDDDPALRRTVSTVLGRAGHEVSEAGTGREAIRFVEAGAPDLVVTDINMPEMDGIELILHLADSSPGLPIVAMSGGGVMPKELLLGNAGLLGALETIPKPFDAQTLLDAVQRVLSG